MLTGQLATIITIVITLFYFCLSDGILVITRPLFFTNWLVKHITFAINNIFGGTVTMFVLST